MKFTDLSIKKTFLLSVTLIPLIAFIGYSLFSIKFDIFSALKNYSYTYINDIQSLQELDIQSVKIRSADPYNKDLVIYPADTFKKLIQNVVDIKLFTADMLRGSTTNPSKEFIINDKYIVVSWHEYSSKVQGESFVFFGQKLIEEYTCSFQDE
jgi:hypothetical protein